MSGVMTRWSQEIDAAQDDAARKALLGRIGVWRATQLSDIAAQRQASAALARLHSLLGNDASAEREARSLVSLCQTHPPAPREDLAEAQKLLRNVGGGKAVVGPRPADDRRERRKKDSRRESGRNSDSGRNSESGRNKAEPNRGRNDKASRVATALEYAQKGRWDDANKALAGGKGPRTQLARAYIRLAWALSAPDDAARVAGAREVQAWLGETLGGSTRPAQQAAAAPARKADAPVDNSPAHPLDDLVGKRVPKRWRDRLALLEAAVVDNPGEVDRIASLALDHHVAVSGERSPAPWLASLVSTALADGGSQTRKTIDEMSAHGVFAVSLYSEPAFGELVAMRTVLTGSGWTVTSVRRGVLSRGEPADRRVWTLRAERSGSEVLYARAPESDTPWEGDLARRIAARLPELCERTALYAPGSGNDTLREEAAKLGVTVFASAEEAAAGLGDIEAVQAPSSPKDELGTLLSEGVPDAAELDAATATFGRAYQAFRTARPVLGDRTDSDAPAARLAFLQSIDRTAPEHVRIPEGTSWAVGLEASGLKTGLLGDDTRFGGPGIETVVAIATALAGQGMSVERVQIGASRKERREDEVLSTLDAPYGGLWRMAVGDVEVALLTDLTPEGRVAATRLLTNDAPRVVVIPIEGDLLSWWRTTGGADPIGWTGSEGQDIAQAVKQAAPAAE